MAIVSALYVTDDVVGPHLELLRNVCEPQSTSRPHITVRYFEKLDVPAEHLNTCVDHIDVIAPGSFGLEDEWSQNNRTVYLRCESDELLALEHKPHFPMSFFHITIYDGHSVEFARALLRTICRYEWGFRVPLPRDTKLSTIEIKPRNSRKSDKGRRVFRAELRNLFKTITSHDLTWELIDGFSGSQRLEIADLICEHLHKVVAHFVKVDPTRPQVQQLASESPAGKESGEVHITPPELARAVAQYAVEMLESEDAEVHFGDPAVGNGAFFSALLKVLPRERVASAIGIDISEHQAAIALSRWSHRGLVVMLGDYLHMEKLPPRTLVLANPPYQRHQQIPPKYKQALRERASITLDRQVSGRAGLYVYFLLLAHEWMASDAVAAWLIPSEFMQTDYGSAVRYYLTHRVQLIRVHRFDHREPQFENAEVLPAVVVFKNREPSLENAVLLSVGGTLSSPLHYESALVEDLRSELKWCIPTVEEPTGPVAEFRIGDLFTVRRGIATGANDFFVLNKEHAVRLGIPPLAFRPILPKARALPTDIVERAVDGFPVIDPQLCVIDCDLSQHEIETSYPEFAAYLGRAKELGILERNLLRSRKPWYRQEQREPARFLCTYMGRGRGGMPPIRFIWNKSDAIVTNTYLMLYPRPALEFHLRKNPSLVVDVFQMLQEAARETMRTVWRIHAGGLIKIEPGELLQVPLSTTPSWIGDVVEPHL